MSDASEDEGTIGTSAELAIRNRYAAYCFAADDRDPVAMADCFTADAVVEVIGGARLEGRTAIARVQEVSSRRRHLTMNVWITKVGANRAAGRAYFLILQPDGAVAGHGRYDDDLSRDPDGAWRFSRRTIEYVWQADDYARWVRGVTGLEADGAEP
jgi:hypothetical protein